MNVVNRDVSRHGRCIPTPECPEKSAFRTEGQTDYPHVQSAGVIQPSDSPWASPIVMVKKKMARIASVLTKCCYQGRHVSTAPNR